MKSQNKGKIKPYWHLNDLFGTPMEESTNYCSKEDFIRWRDYRKQFGNYFETEEEAMKASEKLKAWKRLKDNGFKFTWVGMEYEGAWCKISFNKDEDADWVRKNMEDLKLLFGDEQWVN